eukprot:14802870-Alexandrium_andersonii.AAC.1
MLVLSRVLVTSMRLEVPPTCFAQAGYLVQVRGGLREHLRTWRFKHGTIAVLAQYQSRGGDHSSAAMKLSMCDGYRPSFLEPRSG